MFPVKSETVRADPVMPIEQLLQPAYFAFKAADNRFYGLLQKCIWDYLGLRLQLYGSKMNKQELQSLLQEKKLPAATCRDLVDILERCEASLFTKAQFNDNKEELLERTRTVLEQVREASL
jgi:hypothetical protein